MTDLQQRPAGVVEEGWQRTDGVLGGGGLMSDRNKRRMRVCAWDLFVEEDGGGGFTWEGKSELKRSVAEKLGSSRISLEGNLRFGD